MNNRIKLHAQRAKIPEYHLEYGTELCIAPHLEQFAKLLIEDVLDEVKERAYYTGDRDWSDEVDRPWIQLEFGYGSLYDAKSGIFK
jgi:hypothetical protein